MILHPERPDGRRVVLCDRCGRDCRATDEHPSFREDDNSLEGDFQHWGCYGSTRYDLMHLSAQLCEDCVAALVQWIDAGRPDAPGGPAKGSGVTIINSTPGEELAYAKDAGLPTTLGTGGWDRLA